VFFDRKNIYSITSINIFNTIKCNLNNYNILNQGWPKRKQFRATTQHNEKYV